MIIKAIRYTVYILVYVVLILISGLLNIVIFKELDWTILLSAKFWLEMVVDYTLYLTVFITTALMVYEIFGDTDAEFLKLEMSIFEMKDTLVSQPFRRDVYNHNFMKKRQVWQEIILTAIGNHERKKKDVYVLETITYPNDREKWSKANIKWHKKNDELKELITDDWINKNLMFRKFYKFGKLTYWKKIKYPEITPNEIIYGVQSLPTNSSLLVRKPLGKRLLLKSVGVLPSMAFKIVYELFQIERFLSTAELLKALAFTIIMLLIHALFGMYASRRAHMDRKSNATLRFGYAHDYVHNNHRYPIAPTYDTANSKNNVIENVSQRKELENNG